MYNKVCKCCKKKYIWSLGSKSQLAFGLCDPCCEEIMKAWYKTNIDDKIGIFDFIDAYIIAKELIESEQTTI